MREEERSQSSRSSKREIAAAWACCGLLALAALIADPGDRSGDPAIAAYAGAHIPDGAARSGREADAEQDLARDGRAELGNVARLPVPVAKASVELSTARESARGRKTASGYCRYAFGYAAAATPAQAAARVRESLQHRN